MAFGVAGAAAGLDAALTNRRTEASDLEAALADRYYKLQLIEAEKQRQQLERERMGMDRQKFDADQEQRRLTQSTANNQRGVQTMVGEFIRTQGITPENRHQIIGTLVEAGRMPTADDLAGPAGAEPYTLSPGAVRFDANNQEVARGMAPASSTPAPFTLGRGQVRYDSAGNEIARGEPFPSPAAGGGGGQVSSLPAAIKDDLITMGTLYDMSNQAEQLGNQIGWQGVGGMMSGSLSQFAAKNLGMGDKTGKEQELRNLIGNITATLARLRGGTSFTANEQALLEQYTPTINDGDNVIKAKLRSLRQFVETKRQNTLRVAGGDLRMGTSGPTVGEQRVIDGVRVEWDGQGWFEVGR